MDWGVLLTDPLAAFLVFTVVWWGWVITMCLWDSHKRKRSREAE